MSQMMADMMQNMMAQMQKEGCNPAEMCQQMVAKLAENQQETSG